MLFPDGISGYWCWISDEYTGSQAGMDYGIVCRAFFGFKGRYTDLLADVRDSFLQFRPLRPCVPPHAR